MTASETYYLAVKALCFNGLCKHEICQKLGISPEQCQDALNHYDLVPLTKKARAKFLLGQGFSGDIIARKLDMKDRYFTKVYNQYQDELRAEQAQQVITQKALSAIALQVSIWLPLVCIDGSSFEPIAARLGLIEKERNGANRALYVLPEKWQTRRSMGLDREAVYRPVVGGHGYERVVSNYPNAQVGSDFFGVELYNIN